MQRLTIAHVCSVICCGCLLFSGACSLYDGSGSNGSSDESNSSQGVAAACDEPGDSDGEELTVEHEDIELMELEYTARGCGGDTGHGECCNVGISVFIAPCDGEEYIELRADEDADFEEIHGTVTTEAAEDLESVAEEYTTRFGCVGQDCYEDCTPAELDDLQRVTGTFEAAGDTGEPFGYLNVTDYEAEND